MKNDPASIINLVAAELNGINRKIDSDALSNYGKDWLNYFKPNPSVILFPEKTQEVVEIIKFANQHLFNLVPSGGRTGLSGGATATNGEIVISLERMNKIFGVDTVESSITAQAGVITQVIQEEAKKNGLLFPVDFASRGSSQIGGNVATNAGGIHVIKYGMTRNWVTSLTVVTGSGQVLQLNKGMFKNATGYDLRHLFIGSEGTLGIITEVTLNLIKPPSNRRVILLSVPKLNCLTTILAQFKSIVELSAFEFFDNNALNRSIDGDFSRFPLKKPAMAFAILEFEEHSINVRDRVFNLITSLHDSGLIIEDIYCEDSTDISKIWFIRENIPLSISKYQPYKNDLSIRIPLIPAFIIELDQILSNNYKEFEVIWFGHIGDGNIHINILKPENIIIEEFKIICDNVSAIIADLILKYQGSISAEHGVGLLKKMYLTSSRSAEEIEIMKQIKKVFDPNGIMNSGKIF